MNTSSLVLPLCHVARFLFMIVVLCALLACNLGFPCHADVAPTTLEQLVRASKYTVVSKVTRIIDVQGAKIAEAEVLETLKGDSRVKKVYFVGQPTWTCDTGDARRNETALLFLESEPLGVDESSPFSKRLRKEIGDNRLWLIAWSGRGRLPVTRIGQTDYVRVLADTKTADVRFPKQIATMPAPNDERIRLAKLVDVIAFVKRKA